MHLRKIRDKVKGVSFTMLVLACCFYQSTATAQEVRIKDLVSVRGNRVNSLSGFGLVVGLNQTGDTPDSFSTGKALASILDQFGMTPDNNQILTQAAAAVLVQADLPPFSQVGSKIDVRLSVLGNASSLAGGVLVMTPLRAADGNIYATSEGPVLLGQVEGRGASTLTVASIPSGGIIEKRFAPDLVLEGKIELILVKPDFTNSERIARAINLHFRESLAVASEPSLVSVRVPKHFLDKITGFISEIEGLSILVDQKATVIINEKTGTVVMGGQVRISDIVITHNGISIQIGEGKNAKLENVMPMQGATVNDFVKSLNQMGVKSADLISILHSIHAAGALRAELKVM